MLEFLNLKPDAFGLDISDLSLKIVKLKKKGKVFGLASFGEAKIKPGIIEGGEIMNEQALSEIIQEALIKVKGEKLKTKYVIASLPEEKAFLEVIKLPLMAEKEAKKAVYFEAENYIPLPVEQVYLDSQIIRRADKKPDHIDILIAAVPKKTVDPYVSVLKKSGLKPLILEIESQAVSRALIKKEESSGPLLIIDLGATKTSFIIFSGHSVIFTASRPISSINFTRAIAEGLGIDFNKAEELKVKYGIEESSEGKRILKVLNPGLNELVGGIKKYLDYCNTHTDSKMVEKILLCGGGANLKGLTNFLSAELKVPIGLGNPWINILPVSPSGGPKPLKEVPELPYAESLRYTTALGLALRTSYD